MKPMDRGTFVKLAGVGAAGLAAAGPAQAAGLIRGRSTRLKAGLILPSEGSYTRMADSFLHGFRQYMAEAKVSASVVTRPARHGVDGAWTATNELAASGLDVIVAGVTAPVARLVTPVVNEARVPLVVAGVGGHVSDPADRSPFVLQHSLLYWQASFAMGRWAARRMGRRAYLASSVADSGYDTIYAFARGFESEGGTVVGRGVTHHDPHRPGYEELFAEIGAANPGFVFASYSGPLRVEFLKAYAESGLRRPLAGTGFLVEDFNEKSLGPNADRIRTCASWTRSDPRPENQAFVAAYARAAGRQPDPFSVLGYDTAALIVAGIRNADRNGVSRSRLVEALTPLTVASPRGTLTVDAPTNTVLGPLFVRQVQAVPGRFRQYANMRVASVPAVPALPVALSPLDTPDRSGYYNEVLCA